MSDGVIRSILALIAANLGASLVSSLSIALAYVFLYPFIFSPLKGIPGPRLYKITRLPSLNDQRIESRNVKLNRWHSKYGRVVQIGPNEVSLAGVEHLQRVYIHGNFPKSSFYAQFHNFGELNAFSLQDKAGHRQRKKAMVPLYTKTSVFQSHSQEHLNKKIMNLIGFVGRSQKSMDVYELFNALAMDVITYYELGEEFSTDLLLDLKQRDIIEAFRASSSMWFYTTLAPFLWDIAADATTATLSGRCREWSRDRFLEAYSKVENCKSPSLVRTLYDLGLPKWAIGSEVFDHLAAGHETTGASLAYCAWQLSRPINKHIKDRIFEEMCQNFGKTPLDYLPLEKVDKLPYVTAVVLETTRLHAAIPGSEPRIVDSSEGYAVELPSGKIEILPKGTIVSVQPWTVHQDPSIFVEADKFHPERWLQQHDETEPEYQKRLQVMRSAMFAFGAGNRMCLGMNVAVTEMKLCVAQLYWRFQSSVSMEWCKTLSDEPAMMGLEGIDLTEKESLNDVQLMSMADSYTSRPMFNECWLNWEERV